MPGRRPYRKDPGADRCTMAGAPPPEHCVRCGLTKGEADLDHQTSLCGPCFEWCRQMRELSERVNCGTTAGVRVYRTPRVR